MKVIVNNTDITAHIVDGSYNINSSEQYESWTDGNGVEHRIVVRAKVSGSFDFVCCDQTMTVSDFLALFSSAETGSGMLIGMTVLNKGIFEVIEAFYDITSKDHIKKGDGRIIDVLTVKIQER